MLHIILGILKFAGITIGVLLLLLLLIIFLILFVPVRYRAQISKREQILGAEVKISWLLHTVSMKVSAGSGKTSDIRLRLFGFQLPFFSGKRKKAKTAISKPRDIEVNGIASSKSSAAEKSRSASLKTNETVKCQTSVLKTSDVGQKEKNHAEVSGVGGEQKHVSDRDVSGAINEEYETEVREKTSPYLRKEKTKKESQYKENQNQENQKQEKQENAEAVRRKESGKFEQICFRIQSFYDRIKQIPVRIQRMISAAKAIPKRLKKLFKKIKSMLDRPAQLLEMAEKYSVFEVIKTLQSELFLLWKHYGPRRIQGFLDFGTGDPATTGQLTGLIYLILPAGAEEFEIHPDFYNAKLETEFTCSGHIRAIHVIRVGIKILMDQKIRRLIAKLMR